MPSLFFTTRQRGIQRELPSTLTNGQKVGRMFQRKMFHVCWAFLCEVGVTCREALFSPSVPVPRVCAAS